MFKFSRSFTFYLLMALLLFSESKSHGQVVQIGMGNETPGFTLYSPVYRYSATSTTSAARSNIIYTAAELSAVGITSGVTITAIAFNKLNSANFVTPATFKVYMGNTANNPPLATTTTWASILTSQSLVYDNNTFNIPLAPGWVTITLTTPFIYTGGSLEIATDMAMTGNGGATDNFAWEYTTGFATSSIGVASAAATLNGTVVGYKQRPNIKFTIISGPCTNPPVAGTATSNNTTPVCPGTAVLLTLTGNSNGSGLTYEWESSASNTPFTPTSLGAASPVSSATVNPAATTWYRAKAICSNGTPVYSTPVQVQVSNGLAAGTYTINNTLPTSGTNYNSFANAIAAMNCGILGPVVFNVVPGTPYVETVTFGNIAGTSAVNKIRINGNGALVQFTNTTTDRQLLTLSGTKYLTIDSLNFKSLATDFGWGAVITNAASNDSIMRCKFDLSSVTSISSANTNGITFSASTTAAITAGLNGTNCYISGNHILCAAGTGGAYYGIGVASGGNDNNIIRNNTLENFYYYGIYVNAASGTQVLGNDLHKTNKTGSLTSFYGIYLTGVTPGTKVEANRLHNPIAASAASTSSFYGIYNAGEGTSASPVLIANNTLYNINQGGIIYGLYNSTAPYTNIYHNTVTIDKILTGTSANYGIYATGTNTGTTVANNIVNITAGTLGTKYGVYYSTAASVTDAQKNNVYVNSTQTGTQNYGYYTTAYATLAAFQAAYPALETGAPSENPQFASAATGDLTPGNVALFGTGTNLQASVPRDILNVPRSLTPTPGAFELTSTATNDAGVIELVTPSGTICTGTQSVSVKVMNGGVNIINNVQVHWTINGVAQTTVNYTSPINTVSSPMGNTAVVTLGNVNFTTTPTAIKAWTYLPNGSNDTVYVNDTLQATVAAALSGTFTINSAAPTAGNNYQTFTEFANDLNTYGVCGPVTANVVAGSGPYVEFVKFNNIAGSSTVNKIRINGNGATVQFNNTATNRQLLTLEGTKYLSVDSLTFKSLNATYGWGALVTAGAEYDTLKRCTFDLTSITSTASANSAGIAFSGSNTSATTAGVNGSNCYLGYNKILGTTGSGGPYYGITLVGTHDGNVVDHNTLHNFYYYGLYVSGGTNARILSNDINRSDKTSVTTFYGMYLTGSMPGLRVVSNRIHDPADASVSSTSTFYGLYATSAAGTATSRNLIANNAIYNVNQGGIVYGLYASTTSYTELYHNTILLDKVLSGTSTIYGIYTTGTSNTSLAKNNNVSITAGTEGTKYGFYYSSATSILNHQRNNIYVNSTQPGTQYYGYRATAYATLAAFQAANPTLELGSVSVDPQFIAPATGNLIPGNYALLGNGENLATAVPLDILGVTRMSLPTPGAFEIAPTGTNNAGSVNLISPKGNFCAGLQPVNVSVVNAGTNDITSMKIYWQVNGVTQPVFNYTSTLNSIINAGQFLDTVLLGNAAFASGLPTTIKIWTYQPNNGTDIFNTNDTIEYTLEPAVFTIDAARDTLCPNGSVAINLTPSTGYIAGNLSWQSSDDGVNWSDIANTDVAAYTTGALTADTFFRVKISGGVNSCYSDSVRLLVVNPQLISSEDMSRCGPGTVTFTANASENSLIKWYNSPTATVPIGTGNTFTTPFIPATTTYYVSAGIGSSPSTCETPRVPVVVTVNPVPAVDLGPDINICVDEDHQEVLDAGIHPNNVTYLWDDNTTSQIRGVTVDGTYSVIVTNEYSCSDTDTVAVILRNNPKVNLGNDTTVCNGTVLNLDAGTEGIDYFWSTGLTTQSITVNTEGSYNVFVTNSEGCIKSDTIMINMDGELPSIQGISVTNNGQQTFQFTAIDPQNVIGFEWDFGDGTPHSYATAPVHTYANGGNYVVVLHLSSSCGFYSDSSSAHILGINEMNVGQHELMVYPNPAKETVTIKNSGTFSMQEVAVYNVLGQVIYKAKADSRDKHNLALGQFASGVYTIEIFTDKGTIARKLEVIK